MDNLFFFMLSLILICLILIVLFILFNQQKFCLFGRCKNSMYCRNLFERCNKSKRYRSNRYPWLNKNPLFQDS